MSAAAAAAGGGGGGGGNCCLVSVSKGVVPFLWGFTCKGRTGCLTARWSPRVSRRRRVGLGLCVKNVASDKHLEDATTGDNGAPFSNLTLFS